MQGQWYFLYHSKTNAFGMCDTDVARIGDLRCRQCNAITEDNGLLFFGPCTSHRQHHLEYSLRNHKRAVGVRLTLRCMRLLGRRLVAPQLERRERTNRDVVSVRIPERELLCSSIRVRVRLLFEPGDERACPFKGHIEIVDAEKQEEPVARCPIVRARQRRMLVRAPLVEAEQDSSIRIEDLTKVVMGGSCLGLAEE